MEQENLNNIEVQTETTEEKSILNKVTPLSKYLAMILFVLMPFIGGWIGYSYAPEKVVEVESVVIQDKEIVPLCEMGIIYSQGECDCPEVAIESNYEIDGKEIFLCASDGLDKDTLDRIDALPSENMPADEISQPNEINVEEVEVGGSLSIKDLDTSSSTNTSCDIVHPSGDTSCMGYFPGYVFNKNDQQCKFTIWGCGGPPFELAEECQLMCEEKYEDVEDLGNGYFLVDNQSISFDGEIIDGVDISSFEVLSGGYAKDENQVYLGKLDAGYLNPKVEILNIDDPNSFQVLENSFNKDDVSVYYVDEKIPNIDPATFEVFGGGYPSELYASDKNHIVCSGYAIDLELDPSGNTSSRDIKVFESDSVKDFNEISCENRRSEYFSDGQSLFYQRCVYLEDIDYGSLDPLCEEGDRFLKDSISYIYKGIRVTDEEYQLLSNGNNGTPGYSDLYLEMEKRIQNVSR